MLGASSYLCTWSLRVDTEVELPCTLVFWDPNLSTPLLHLLRVPIKGCGSSETSLFLLRDAGFSGLPAGARGHPHSCRFQLCVLGSLGAWAQQGRGCPLMARRGTAWEASGKDPGTSQVHSRREVWTPHRD